MSIERKRLSPDESRSVALDAARDILIAEGPQSVTLKAVSARIGKTHANLLHHFGSALGLQKALAAMLAETVCDNIAATVCKARRGECSPQAIVDMTFDAFDGQGAGALAAWMLMTGDRDALDPILESIHRLVDELSVDNEDGLIREDTLTLVFMALGDALLGKAMAKALGLPREAAREIAYRQLLSSPGVQARMAALI
ncbi:TetR family transcriptional regulator [Sphingomonas paeninsulae]|jgi:AcrR family transcriptional regulator|uniref:TetR family transcriptional regulator n=1 Tax=Sphingomonas paeninsulae TaxID=2319844 RepID=A0A494TJX5_SPHPE|nr:TetR family transcriptional regulator [Sphingomonas paeninsulae]AYJ86116.1 TetR family transcriptional regulator [Sphingomonas paeninsulae]